MKNLFRLQFIFSLLVILVSCAGSPKPGEMKLAQDLYAQYFDLAETYMELSKYDKALPLYETAREDQEFYWTSTYRMAKIYVNQKNWPKATVLYEELLKRDQNNSSLKESLAYCYAMSGNREKALSVYEELFKGGNTSEDILSNIISINASYLKDEKLSENKKQTYKDAAETYFERLKEMYPENKNISAFEKIFNPEQTS